MIDNPTMPSRKITAVRDARNLAKQMGVAKFLTLDCGHEVGLKDGFPVPEQAFCLKCHQNAEKQP